jgi:hypothetical protein
LPDEPPEIVIVGPVEVLAPELPSSVDHQLVNVSVISNTDL